MEHKMDEMNWRQRLLACCAFTLGGSALEGMWGAALRETCAGPFSLAQPAIEPEEKRNSRNAGHKKGDA
jgi:hypothetical protein